MYLRKWKSSWSSGRPYTGYSTQKSCSPVAVWLSIMCEIADYRFQDYIFFHTRPVLLTTTLFTNWCPDIVPGSVGIFCILNSGWWGKSLNKTHQARTLCNRDEYCIFFCETGLKYSTGNYLVLIIHDKPKLYLAGFAQKQLIPGLNRTAIKKGNIRHVGVHFRKRETNYIFLSDS